MSAVAMPRGERMGCEVRATPDVAEALSRSEAPSRTVEFKPEEFPLVDAYYVEKVISGKYSFKKSVKHLAPAPFEERRPDAQLLKADAPASVPSSASSSVPNKVFQPAAPPPLSRTWAAVVRQKTPAQEEPERPAPSARKQFPARSLEPVRGPTSQPPASASAKNTQSSADGKSDDAEPPGPVGTKPRPEHCRSINVWGLSGNATEEELRSLCSKFGTVTDVNLLDFKADGGLGCATITFEKASAAHKAQSFLQRTILHGKEIRVGLDADKDGNHHWLHVWIKADVTARKLYEGFFNAGAPCIDARVVLEPFGDDMQGVGAVAFRTTKESQAVRYALPLSHKTNWSKYPNSSCWPCEMAV